MRFDKTKSWKFYNYKLVFLAKYIQLSHKNRTELIVHEGRKSTLSDSVYSPGWNFIWNFLSNSNKSRGPWLRVSHNTGLFSLPGKNIKRRIITENKSKEISHDLFIFLFFVFPSIKSQLIKITPNIFKTSLSWWYANNHQIKKINSSYNFKMTILKWLN